MREAEGRREATPAGQTASSRSDTEPDTEPVEAGVCSLGIDIGSVYVSAAVVDSEGRVIRHDYRKHEGNIVETVRDVVADLGADDIAYAAKTGNGSDQIENAGPSLDPTVSLLYGAKRLYPDVRNVIYIGAGSFYLIILNEKGEYLRHTANTACASGTGAFLEQQALRLGTTPEGLHELARNAKSCPSVATRCAVFAKTDIIHLQQAGYGREDISAGICRGMAESTMDALLKGRSISGPTVVVGGVAKSSEIIKYVERKLGSPVDVPDNPELVGAVGAACYAATERARSPLASVCKAETAQVGRLRRPPLALTKSTYPDFDFFDSRMNDDQTEVALTHQPERKCYDAVLGIDIGSTSTKCALVTRNREPLLIAYRKTAGDPIGATQLLLKAVREEMQRFGFDLNIMSVGTTGSGRKLIKKVIRADLEMNEITSHARAAVHLDPEVDTILEIGGQDSKFTQLNGGVVYNSVMNYVCAAGTGSFIEEQAKRLDISIWDYGDMVLGTAPPRTSDRCTVFMERDLDVLLAEGWSKKEVAAAVLYSVCENYLNKIVSGQHIGERVYFQGATARNKALVAAFEQTLGKPIIVSPFCHMTGAYGTALLLLDRGVSSSTFRGLDFADAKIQTTNEKCTVCRNECELTVIDVEGEKVGWGMKCGKEYEETTRSDTRNPHYDAFRVRRKLLHHLAGMDPATPKFIAGMPMSLTSYGYLPLWGTFLRELGGKVILTRTTSEETLKQGLHYSQAEFCAPIIAGHGHIAELMESGADFIFLPHMIRATSRTSFSDSHFCPFVQSFPSVMRATEVVTGSKIPIVSPAVEFPRGIDHMSRALRDGLREATGASLLKIQSALRKGLKAQREFDRRLKEEGRKIADELKELGEMGIVVMGRPYNVNDPGLDVNLPEKIADMGVTTIPMDFIQEGKLEERWKNMFWNYGQSIVRTARTVADSDNLFAILFTNFCCGPDSYIITYFKEIMNERRKPFLVVQFDAHGADAGYVTRVEAAFESFRSWKPTKRREPRPIKKYGEIERNRTIFFPPMDPIAVHFFTAAFEGVGFKAEVLREDEETLDIGYKHVLGSECVPCPSTLGSFIKTVEERGLKPSEVALFMPTAHGPCRFGQYTTLDRIVFERKGWHDVQIVSPSSEDAYLGLSRRLRMTLWHGIVAGDILTKILLKIRPYETSPGAADNALEESIALLQESFRQRGHGVREAMMEAVRLFKAVETTNGQKPKVGIVGEIYVRNDDFINQHVARAIESYGGEALKTSIAEWIFYTSYMHRFRRERTVKEALGRVKNWLQEFYFNHVEHGLYDIAKDIIHDRPEPKIDEIIEAGRKYIPIEFEGEAILTVGRALIYIEREGVDAVVNASPTFCMPGTTTTSIFARIEDEKGVPIICNFYDGSGEPNKVLRPHLHCLSHR